MSHTTPLSQQLERDDVVQVVQAFYSRVLTDPLLAPHFARVEDWQAHERFIVDFWWGVMGGKVTSPRANAMVEGHRHLRIGPEELGHWLDVFNQTLTSTLPPGPARQWAALARQIGDRMAGQGLLRR